MTRSPVRQDPPSVRPAPLSRHEIADMERFVREMQNRNLILLRQEALVAARTRHAFGAPRMSDVARATGDLVRMANLCRQGLDAECARLREDVRQFETDVQLMAAQAAAARLAFQEAASLGIFRRLQALIDEHRDSATAFKEAGWPIAPSMPYELRSRVTSMHKAQRTRYISRAIIGYYQRQDHKHTRQAVRAWASNELFAPRMHILMDALDLHCQGRYVSSVPTLMPQIEGILREYVQNNGLEYKFPMAEVFGPVLDTSDYMQLANWVISETLRYQLQHNTYAYSDFKAELTKPGGRRQVSRHTVLHGITLGYDRPIHSLRACLLLDALSALEPPEDETTV